jgi:hypothetical protein
MTTRIDPHFEVVITDMPVTYAMLFAHLCGATVDVDIDDDTGETIISGPDVERVGLMMLAIHPSTPEA